MFPRIPRQSLGRALDRALAVLHRLHDLGWPLPAASFVAGALSFALLQRGALAARWVPLSLLLSEILVARQQAIAARLRPWMRDGGAVAVRWLVQSFHQEAFFFSLPFIWTATTWDSRQIFFTAAVIAGGLVSLIDPLYERLAERRAATAVFHGFALFVALLVALPLVLAVDSAFSLCLSAGLAGLLTFVTWRGWRDVRRPPSAAVAIAVAAACAAAAWSLRAAVPPAPLRLIDAAVTDRIDTDQRAPSLRLIDVEAGRANAGGLYAYSAVRAPVGLHDHIEHVWVQDGRIVDRIALQLSGGRREGYRTWSHKRGFPADPRGRWRVEVRTTRGQLVGVVPFRVH